MTYPHHRASRLAQPLTLSDRTTPGSALQSLISPSSVRRATVRQGRASSDPGNTLATATPWGISSGKRTIQDTVRRQDTDIFKLVFDDLTDVKLTFNNRSQANLAGSLLNSQGQPLSLKKNQQFGKVGSQATFQHTFEQLPAGTYFLRVQGRSNGKQVYKLTLALSSSFPPFPPCGC